MGLRISPIKIKIVLESNPLKSTMLIERLGVYCSLSRLLAYTQLAPFGVPGDARTININIIVNNTCMYVCMHVCMYVCMYVCVYIYIYICIETSPGQWGKHRLPSFRTQFHSVTLAYFLTTCLESRRLSILIHGWVFIIVGCSGSGVQWIGVVLYNKLVCKKGRARASRARLRAHTWSHANVHSNVESSPIS